MKMSFWISGLAVMIVSSVMLPTAFGTGSKTFPSRGAATRYPSARLDASALHSWFISTDGAIRCWGDNSTGELGTGNPGGSIDAPAAVRTETGLTNAVAVATGGGHTCALTAD